MAKSFQVDKTTTRFILKEIQITTIGQFEEFTMNIPAVAGRVKGLTVIARRIGNAVTPLKANKHYFGVAEEPAAVDNDFVQSLTIEKMESKCKVFNVNPGSGEYIWYLRPVRLGKPYFELDGVSGGLNLHETTPIVSVTDDHTLYTEDYYVYRSDSDNEGQTQVYAK